MLLQHRGQPLPVIGDFNQAVPRRRHLKRVYQALQSAFDGLLEIGTAGYNPELDQQLIDHIAHSRDLKAGSVTAFSHSDDDGLKLSNHDGVVVELAMNL